MAPEVRLGSAATYKGVLELVETAVFKKCCDIHRADFGSPKVHIINLKFCQNYLKIRLL